MAESRIEFDFPKIQTSGSVYNKEIFEAAVQVLEKITNAIDIEHNTPPQYKNNELKDLFKQSTIDELLNNLSKLRVTLHPDKKSQYSGHYADAINCLGYVKEHAGSYQKERVYVPHEKQKQAEKTKQPNKRRKTEVPSQQPPFASGNMGAFFNTQASAFRDSTMLNNITVVQIEKKRDWFLHTSKERYAYLLDLLTQWNKSDAYALLYAIFSTESERHKQGESWLLLQSEEDFDGLCNALKALILNHVNSKGTLKEQAHDMNTAYHLIRLFLKMLQTLPPQTAYVTQKTVKLLEEISGAYHEMLQSNHGHATDALNKLISLAQKTAQKTAKQKKNSAPTYQQPVVPNPNSAAFQFNPTQMPTPPRMDNQRPQPCKFFPSGPSAELSNFLELLDPTFGLSDIDGLLEQRGNNR